MRGGAGLEVNRGGAGIHHRREYGAAADVSSVTEVTRYENAPFVARRVAFIGGWPDRP